MHSNPPSSPSWHSGCFRHSSPGGAMTQNSQTDSIAEMADTTILVVEDGDAVRKMICAMLSQSGYQCFEAADGNQALRLLRGIGRVNLVLTDLVMPGMNGTE